MSSTNNDDMDADDADLLAAVESAENPSAAVAEAAVAKGFVTATGKTVTVSESSLEMARRLWSSMSEDEIPAPEAHLKQMTELKRVSNDRCGYLSLGSRFSPVADSVGDELDGEGINDVARSG